MGYLQLAITWCRSPGWRADDTLGHVAQRKFSILALFIMSRFVICSPVWRFCATWLLSCKRPIRVAVRQCCVLTERGIDPSTELCFLSVSDGEEAPHLYGNALGRAKERCPVRSIASIIDLYGKGAQEQNSSGEDASMMSNSRRISTSSHHWIIWICACCGIDLRTQILLATAHSAKIVRAWFFTIFFSKVTGASFEKALRMCSTSSLIACYVLPNHTDIDLYCHVTTLICLP